MKINIPITTIVETDINEKQAFDLLLKATLMDDMLLDDSLEVKHNTYGEKVVYRVVNGHDETFDDRGDLFVALRNVACCLYPNLPFRGADYIYVGRES